MLAYNSRLTFFHIPLKVLAVHLEILLLIFFRGQKYVSHIFIYKKKILKIIFLSVLSKLLELHKKK